MSSCAFSGYGLCRRKPPRGRLAGRSLQRHGAQHRAQPSIKPLELYGIRKGQDSGTTHQHSPQVRSREHVDQGPTPSCPPGDAPIRVVCIAENLDMVQYRPKTAWRDQSGCLYKRRTYRGGSPISDRRKDTGPRTSIDGLRGFLSFATQSVAILVHVAIEYRHRAALALLSITISVLSLPKPDV
ncbi:uncharacterized protein PgNI_08102 [Pyricularia grisea]|uniref:Uncharacterized protein n=1 Tax=Pyricularia grisea TaxID=148305 RepID=A0A6P8AVM6_PYRGI|nr:uncharacterized protein PgNI_08102 [Pyricularia grisea]TLD06276.1 hypothetical protein PgNI_08102 [Pyricularia grisea]